MDREETSLMNCISTSGFWIWESVTDPVLPLTVHELVLTSVIELTAMSGSKFDSSRFDSSNNDAMCDRSRSSSRCGCSQDGSRANSTQFFAQTLAPIRSQVKYTSFNLRQVFQRELF